MNYSMTYKLMIACIATIILFASCEPNVLFQEASPPDIESITKFPADFQGVYVCESDSSRMIVEPFIAYNESFHIFETSIDRIRETENCSILGQGLYLPGRKECIPFEYISDDSIMAKIYSIDTLFNFRKHEVLKLYKGRLFINYKSSPGEWVTFMISPLEDGSLNWELIDIPDRTSKVEAITSNYISKRKQNNDRKFIIKPTLVEFDRILEKDYTRECDILTPIHSILNQ